MSIKADTLAKVLATYAVKNQDAIKADFARALGVPIDKYCRKVTKIKGVYQVYYTLMTHIVHGFKSEWKALGEFHVRDKEIKNYRQKINFAFKPDDIMGTAMAEWYEEGKKLTDKEISKKILDWIFTQITDDLALLSMIGEYDSTKAHGQFGFSVDGFNAIVRKMLENTNNPCYRIPLDIFTDTNIVSELTKFERNLPKLFKSKIKEIHMSSNNVERYSIDYSNTHGKEPSFKVEDKFKSPLGNRAMIGHDDMGDDIVFATADKNMLDTLDLIENPATITDIQVQDYDVKVFGEFTKGWDFLINEAVCVANFTDTTLGLGDTKLMELYYPHETV